MAETATYCRCFHCGLAVADPKRWTVRINDVDEPMCCPGCQSVAGAIIAGGLENYYQFRRELAPKAELPSTVDTLAKERAQALAYDDPALQKSFVTTVDGISEVQLYIEGIHCAACCWLIEHALQQISVASITVSLATHKALLRWDARQHPLSEILLRIRQVGYNAQPYRPSIAQQGMDQQNRTQLLRLGVAGIGMMQAMMFALALYSGDFSGIEDGHKQLMRVFALLVTLPVIFYSAIPFFSNAWRNVRNFHAGMDLPVGLALLIAFAASVHAVIFRRGEVYFDSISMFVFLLLLARYAENTARRRLLDFPQVSPASPACECLIDPDQNSHFEIVAVNAVEAGQVVRVKAGETIPLDGIVISGSSSVNESVLNGEQSPLTKKPGDSVFAGTINGDGVLTLRVSTTAGHTRLDMISRLAEWSLGQKPRVSVIADRYASVFTLLVIMLASVAGWYWHAQGSAHTLAIVLSILVVSCPCALSLATPSALAFCYQSLRKNGLLVNSANIIEQTRDISHVVFDKTGTLTRGIFSISNIKQLASETMVTQEKRYTRELILELASALEQYSEHPIAAAFKTVATDLVVTDVHISSGKGVEGMWQGEGYRIGSWPFCAAWAGDALADKTSSVYLVKQNQWLAAFELTDEVRPEALQLVTQLQQMGKQVEILSGDSSGAAEHIGLQLGIPVCHSQMSPEKKLDYITALQAQGHRVLMVGDGINDIPVLAKADVSIAMNNASDLAKIKADAVLLRESLMPMLDLLRHCAKTRRVILQNILWALLYNGLALPLAALGLVAPWQAALGMSISSLWVTFNSLRLRRL